MMGQFLMSTRIYTGEASLEEIEHLGLKRAYIICDPFMEKCGRAGELAAMLNGAGAETRIFSEVVPDPSIEVVAKAIQGMKEFEPDGIIALGGGSAIDTAKAAGHLYGSMNGEGRPLLAAVPTTSGTGSEVTSFAVISDTKAQAKYALRDQALVPDAAFLDPRLTSSVPPAITADTGMDVLTHGLEAYVSAKADDFTDAVIAAYQQVLEKCAAHRIMWLQLDEPALVRDLSKEDIALFHKIYENILPCKKTVEILLQTYFGDVRDIYKDLTELPFDGIGLDFIEGKETVHLIEKYGFPKDKLLFAGLVNGKNIWRNHYDRTLNQLQQLTGKGIQTVLSTSCSLLHVPYTVKHETKLSEKYLDYFAFAEEKLSELKELSGFAENPSYTQESAYKKNSALFAADRDCKNAAVKKRLSEVTEKDYVRLPKRSERQQLQKETFHLPQFPTTTIGSFPQTKDVKQNRAAFRKGEITEQEYTAFNKKKIAECIKKQEEIGLDVLVHGEYERNDMVEYFGEALGGFLFTEKAWVQSYGTRCVKPPIIWGDVYREKPMTVAWSVYAQSLTDKIMKGMLTGPVTILNWSFPREDISIKESISQIALAIRDEVLDLEANGIRMIQIDEAALREKLPLRRSDWNKEYLDFAIPAFRLTHSGVKPETQIHTHMCYSEFTDIIPAIDAMDADVITFEASRSDLQILSALRENHFETEVGPGVYDIHSPRVPSVEEIVQVLEKMLTQIEPDKLWVNPDCGLKTRGIPETQASLINMVQAAKQIRVAHSK